MNKIKLYLFIVFLSVTGAVNAQGIKPAFKNFILVQYRPSGKGAKKFIRIESYTEINSEGVVRDTYNVFENDYGDLSLKGYMGDTSYKAPDSLIIVMNKVFGDGKKLNYQTELKRLDPDKHFAGPFDFISYIDLSGKTHNFVMATDADVDDNVNFALDKLWHLEFAAIHHQGKVYRNPILEATILKCHNTCKNVPAIEEPPTVMELKKN